jgi:hypothetical protein
MCAQSTGTQGKCSKARQLSTFDAQAFLLTFADIHIAQF